MIPRERALDFLARLERKGAFEDGDSAWWSWEEAVIKLGASELEPALRRVWAKFVFNQHRPEEHEESLAELHRAAADLANPALLDEDETCVIADPVEALAWIGRFSRPEPTASAGVCYPRGVCVHHPGVFPKVNREKPWILFKT